MLKLLLGSFAEMMLTMTPTPTLLDLSIFSNLARVSQFAILQRFEEAGAHPALQQPGRPDMQARGARSRKTQNRRLTAKIYDLFQLTRQSQATYNTCACAQ